jgi:hypothetical protein
MNELTKREQFALAAMQGLCTKEGAYHRCEHLALDAVNLADAMMAALSTMLTASKESTK